ncbi:MAG TPA: hypothetical protein EYG86_09890 [Crocinitomicaceae bacterium]|nr:hypothetical protein [Crocinitomicaceae bacterium]
MAVTDVYNDYLRLEDDQIILSFKGDFTAELLTSFLHILEGKMEDFGTETKKKRRVFNVLTESFQNLYHHIEDLEKEGELQKIKKSALVIVKYEEGKFSVLTGNYIDIDSVDELKDKLTMVNKLNPEELRALYRVRLETNPLSTKGTAGLGLIDIARKSKSKLDYEFINVDTTSSFFCLNVIIE